MTSSTVTTPDHAVLAHDRHRDEIVVAREPRDFFAVGGDGNDLHLFPRDVADFAAFGRGEQLAQRHHALRGAPAQSVV